MYDLGKYACYVLELDGQIKGYASFVWEEGDILLLDYFAIVAKERGSGIGSTMLKLLMKELKDKFVILECESPEYAKSVEEKILRQRRINFYLKNGSKETDIETKLAGGYFNILYISQNYKYQKLDIEKEISKIYRNMYPKVIFKNIMKIV